MARFNYHSGEKERLDEIKKEICMVLRRSMGRQPNYSATRLAIQLRTSRARVSGQGMRVESLRFAKDLYLHHSGEFFRSRAHKHGG